jgi:hypothetical protein
MRSHVVVQLVPRGSLVAIESRTRPMGIMAMAGQSRAPTASRRTFVSLAGGVLAATLSASARSAESPASAVVPEPVRALAETRFRRSEIEFHAIDSRDFALEDRCAKIGSLMRGFLRRAMQG